MSADAIYLDGDKLSFSKKGVFPFHCYYETGEVAFGEEGSTHGDIYNNKFNNKFDFEGAYIAGRIWVGEKIIAFWDYDFSDMDMDLDDGDVKHHSILSSNSLTFRETLKLIEEQFNSKEHQYRDDDDDDVEVDKISIDDEWMIDVPLNWMNEDDYEDYYKYDYYMNKYVLLPLKEFEKGIKIDKQSLLKAKEVHMMNWKEREQYYKENPDKKAKGFGSDAKWDKVKGAKSLSSDREMTPAQWEYWHKRENKNMGKIKDFKLFESPDHPNTQYKNPETGEWKELDYEEEMYYRASDAFPFGYVANSELWNFRRIKEYQKDIKEYKKLIIKAESDLKKYKEELSLQLIVSLERNIKNYKTQLEREQNDLKSHKKHVKMWLEEFNVKSIAEYKRLPNIKHGRKIYTMFVGKIGSRKTHGGFGTDRDEQLLNGRIWVDRKYIAFWNYPKTYEELISVIKDVEAMYKKKYGKNLNIIKNLDKWIVENDEGHVIPVKSYKGGEAKYSEEEMKAPHLMDWEEKKEWKKKQNFGEVAAKNQKKKPIEWRNALGAWRGESVTNIKSFKLFESPDTINAKVGKKKHSLIYYDRQAYAFGYSNETGEMKVTNSASAHDSLDGETRFTLKYPGRFWLRSKILTFWSHPPKEEFQQVLRDIEDAYNKKKRKNVKPLKFDDSWWVEVVYKVDSDEEVTVPISRTTWWNNMYIGDDNEVKVEIKYIKINDYDGSEERGEAQFMAPHLMSPEEKEQYYKEYGKPRGFGSDKSAKEKPIEWRHALGKYRGESKIQKFDSYKIKFR